MGKQGGRSKKEKQLSVAGCANQHENLGRKESPSFPKLEQLQDKVTASDQHAYPLGFIKARCL